MYDNKITDEQLCKLFEMANTLYPELKRKVNSGEWELGQDDYNMINFMMYHKDGGKDVETGAVHWVEFCLLWLPNKLDMPYVIMGEMLAAALGDKEREFFPKHLYNPIDLCYYFWKNGYGDGY